MAAETFDTTPVQRYSISSRRSLIAMLSRRAIRRVNGSAGIFLVRPMVVMAARALGPGPTRLKLVKLAHNLSGRGIAAPVAELELRQDLPAAQPSERRAA